MLLYCYELPHMVRPAAVAAVTILCDCWPYHKSSCSDSIRRRCKVVQLRLLPPAPVVTVPATSPGSRGDSVTVNAIERSLILRGP